MSYAAIRYRKKNQISEIATPGLFGFDRKKEIKAMAPKSMLRRVKERIGTIIIKRYDLNR